MMLTSPFIARSPAPAACLRLSDQKISALMTQTNERRTEKEISRLTLYKVGKVVVDLGWVDFDF